MLASLAGIYIEEVRLDENAQVTQYLPELMSSSYVGATVHDLLDMITATQFDEDLTRSDSEARQKASATGWLPELVAAEPDIYSFLGALQPVEGFSHGEQFKFRSCEADVLGWILERVAEQPIAASLSQRIWHPMGAEFEAHMMLGKSVQAFWDAGLAATLRDLGRFGMLNLKNGFGNGTQVIPFDWVRQTLSEVDSPEFPDQYRQLGFDGYRNNYWIRDPLLGIFLAWGEFGQYIYVHRETNVVIVRLASEPEAYNEDRVQDAINAFEAIVNYLESDFDFDQFARQYLRQNRGRQDG